MTPRSIVHFVLAASLVAMTASCSKQPAGDADRAAGSAEATVSQPPGSFTPEVYRATGDHWTVKLLSPSELEWAKRNDREVLRYSREGNRIRVDGQRLGGTQAVYFEVVAEGLRAEDGTVLLNAAAYGVVRCASNLKELALAVTTYAQEHDETFPPADRWCDAIKQDSGPRPQCFACGDEPDQLHGYAMNEALGGKKLSEVGDAARTVMLFGSRAGWNKSGGPAAAVSHPHSPSSVLVVFVDGHVEEVPNSRLDSLHWQVPTAARHDRG